MKLLLAAVLLCAAFLPSQAQPADKPAKGPGWYRIELIIYANRDPQAAVSETWPLLPELVYPNVLQRIHPLPHRVPAQPEFEPLLDLDIPATFTQVPAADVEFNSQRRRLDRSRDIEVLLHQTWLQPVRDRDNSVPLQIDSQLLSGDFPELQGSILIYRARYLHLETNLWLNTNGSYLATSWTMPLPPLPPMSKDMVQVFPDQPDYDFRHAVLMQQRRRMRSGELHFVDHPMFGLLIKASRY